MSTNASNTTATTSNVVDRAAESADAALRATQRATESALNTVSEKIHGLRDSASPVINRINAPIDKASAYAQEAPLRSLLIAAAAGAALMALVSLLGGSRRRYDRYDD